MNTSAIMNLINDLENRFAVEQWTVGGIHIWPYLRIKLNFDLYYTYHTSNEIKKPSSLTRAVSQLKDIARAGKAFLSDTKKNCWPRRHADVVLISDGVSFAFHDGAWYEKFCDPLIDRLSAHGFSTFLITPNHSYRIPRRSPSLFIQPMLDAVQIKNLLFPTEITANDAIQRDYPAYTSCLMKKNLQLVVPPLDDVRRYASMLLILAEAYQRILRKTTPAVVCIVSFYSMEGMAINLACRQLGIPTIDLQHGIQGELHIAYARWNRIPAEGYELLPTRFWVWSESDMRTIQKWNAPAVLWHSPLAGGNLWLNEWLSGKSSLIARYDRQIQEARKPFLRMPHILVTLQFNLTNEQTLSALLTAIKKTMGKFRWWIRLHPCMLSERSALREMLTRNGITDIELDLATDLPLYALLRNIDLHLTHSSTTVIEAELFGVPSIVISGYGAEFFPDQIASGWALPAFKEQDIITAVDSQLRARTTLRQEQSPDTNIYHDSEQGIAEIMTIIKQHKKTTTTS